MEKLWLGIHLFGLVIGAGSVTTAYARGLYFKYHPGQSKNRGIFPIVTVMLNIGFGLIILSGLGLYSEDAKRLNSSPVFIFKMAMFGLLLANHIFINSLGRARRENLKVLFTFSEYFSLLGWYALIMISLYLPGL